GILADHRRVCQRLGQLQEQFALSDTDSMLVQAYPGQDSFIWETLWPLMFGGRLIFPGPGDQENSLSILSSAIAEQSVSYIHFTPEALLLFLKSWGDESVARLGSLRHVLCSGGLLQRGAVKTFFRRMNCGLTYLYNPPEAAFEIGFHACQPGMSQEVAPAGKPGSALVYILDQNHNLVPIGVPGEICTKAEGLTPLKLKEKNFPLEDENSPLEGENPPEGKNSPLEGGKGGVWIKTGDKGRWLADGTLELTDCPGPRVWKDGVRFNLSEIETALLGHPSVEECHVLSRTANQFHDQDQTREIVSCIAASKPFSTAHIREYLRSCVPPAMIPGAYVPVNSIPLTNEGKADERILTGLEVTDDDLIQRWETGIRSLPEIDQVKVMIREKTIPQSLLHISDVLPGWQAAKAIGQFSTTMLTDVAHREQTGQEPKAMAFSDGGPLHIPEHAPKTLTRALICTARDQKDQGIIVLQDEDSEVFQSYAELLESAKCILAGLQAQGSEPGDAVILQIENMQDHFSAFWACVLGGIIPLTVAIDTSYSQKTGLVNKLWNSWELLDHPPVLASSHLESALSGLPKLFREDSGKLKEFRIISVEQLKQNPPTGNIYESRPEEVAFYQLSSGSTGIPKCIMETHKGAVNYIHGAMAFGNKPEDITVNWLPMDHVVPLLTCHIKDTYMGSVQIHASTRLVLANPLIWLDLVEKYKATYAWAPNFGFKLLTDALSREPGRKWDVSTLEFVLTGGEQITMPVIKETIDKLVPFGLNPSSMRSGYGMAESGTVVVHPNRLNEKTAFRRFLKSSLPGVLQETEDEGEHTITFTNIGRPKAGAQFRAADLENNILPECVIGRLQIKGDMVTPGYLNNEEANQESFVGDGWYNTGDLCFIKDGSMSIIGREKETIIICGANFYCYEIEDVVNSIEGVEPTFSAACAVDSPDSGTEGLAVFFVPQKSEQKINIPLLQSVRENIAKDLGVSPTYVIPLAKDEFPKTTSGKIQRSQLKKALARGEFDTLLKKIEIASKGPDTLPEWFFRQVWQRKELPKEIPGDDKTGFLSHQTGVSLVFLDKLKLGALMCDKSEQYHYVRVEPGTGFLKLNPRHYQINPREPEHYENLISSVTQDNIRIHQILHLWTYDKHKDEISGTEALEDAQYSGVYSLLSLTRALVRGRKDDDAHSIRMLVISSYTQSVSPGDKIAIERTPVLGLVKTISQEISWLDCRHTDLPVDANNVSAGLILRESRTTAKDRETAFRQGQRRIPKLEKLEFSDKQELPFKQDEVILISGGLGGIGIEIARYLLKNHKSRLILVGRTPLSDSEVIPAQADSLASGMSVPERVKVLQELKQIGEVIYEAADVCDLEQMQQIVSQGKKRWHSDLSGVIHLAGTFPTRLLSEETVESFAKTLGPKMLGSWILRQLVSEQGFFISFGSLFGFFGGVATGAYSAANSFLDAFSHYQQETEKKKSYCFSWTNWDEVGMSRGYLLKEQSRSQGYYMIPANKGILSLLAGLHSAHPRIMIGLDSGKPAIQRYMKSPEVCQSRELAAYFTAPEGSSPMAGMPDIRDRFGTPSRCEFIRIPEMPLTESGEIDISKLSEMDQKSAQASAERITPRTGLERTIGAIWQEVLNVENVGIHQNFFEMGGQSILLIRVQKKLQSAFNRDVSVVELLRYPTISSLAKYMSQEQKQKSSFQEAKERAEKQKSARRKKSRPKRR
ncbi:MAG: AMP-binding protein, partial [Desulfobacteraceae bacterium]|nr:AMP-binding protein [Desulfobacteraceae bacterium]